MIAAAFTADSYMRYQPFHSAQLISSALPIQTEI
jgi:hypothetical protein